MKTKKLLLSVCLVATNLYCQVIPKKTYVSYPPIGGTREMVDNVPSALDVANNAAYVSGFTRNAVTLRDYTLIKYDTNGVFQWQKSFDYAGLNDRALSITVDNSGNPIITGEATSLTNGTDIVTRKYDKNGNLLWSKTYNGTSNADDKGLGIITDNSGDVYVCGYSSNTGTGKDFTVIKYNSSGIQQYVYTKNGTSNTDDVANAIAFFGNKLYVSGVLNNVLTANDIYITRLNANNAFVNWSVTENGTSSSSDQALDVKVLGNDVLVCGAITNTGTGQDYFFGKYNATNGINVFKKTYDAFGGNDFATSFVIDASNSYAIVGIVQNSSINEYHTTKYSNSGGLSWINKHETNTNAVNVYPKIQRDILFNHFYVSGLTQNTTLDGVVYQITPGGNRSWIDYHDGFGMRDAHVDISVDNYGRVYLASLNEQSTNVFNTALIQYKQIPAPLPVDYNYPSLNEPFSTAHLFYPNMGQIQITTGNTILFHSKFASPEEYISKNNISFIETRRDTCRTCTDSISRVDMIFDNANEFSRIYPLNFQSDAILNYYLSSNSGITVQGANRLMIPDIYPLIDLHMYSNENGCKYYFVINPGGNPNDISLRFDGAKSTSIVSNNLTINSYLSSWTFKKPDIYNITSVLSTIASTGINGWVNVGGNNYKINPGSYNTSLPLVIEFDKGKAVSASATGNMTWSTYYGGNSDDVGWSVVNDNLNNVYVGGFTESNNFTVTPGAYQSTYVVGDLRNGFITKFNSNKSMAWSTYYGGSDADEVKGLDFDNLNSRLYVVGYTFSTDFPLKNKSGATTSPAFHGSGNAADGFIADFNPSTGQLSWSNLLGANGDDRAIDVKLDGLGNKYVACNSAAGVITLNPGSAYMQPTYNGGFSDGMLYKFSSADQASWITYYGGNNTDYLHSVGVDASNSVYLMGHTNSANLSTLDPGITGEIYQPTNGGGFDWFFVKFNSSGQRLWATYYGGTGDEYSTQERGIVSIGNETYFYGMTASAGLTTKKFASAPVQTYAGNNDTYVLAINTNYNPIWATYLGGTDVDYAGGITKDAAGNIYMSGSTFSSDFPYSIPPSYYSQLFQGASHGSASWIPEGGDAFVAAYSTARNLVWSTWVGGNGTFNPSGDDFAYGISVSPNNKLYITGGTSSRSPYYPSFNPGLPAYYSSPSSGFGNGDVIISEFGVSSLPLVGIYENHFVNNSYILYPNPSVSKVFISNAPEKGKIELYDIRGGKMYEFNSDGGKEEINLETYSDGVYFLRITNKNGSYETYKIIKTK